MTKKIPAAAVPALQLTPQEEFDLRHLGSQLEQEILSQYEGFLFHNDRCVNASTWKLIKTEGDVHAYKERGINKRLHQEDPFGHIEPGPHQKLADQSEIPRVLVTAVIPGTLDDAMYGSSFQDTPSLQNLCRAQGDRVEECAVVAKLDGPTFTDPYRFLGVAWVLRTFPLNILQRRDFLLLAYVGISHLSNGERVGITISHSIEHRDLTELHELNTIRVASSLLTIYRQHDPSQVEVFAIHFLDTKGNATDRCHVQESIRHIMPMKKSACCAGFRKKLEWLVYRRKRNHLDSTPCDAIEPQSSGTNDYCELCEKKLGTLLTCPGTSCELCYQRICSRCCIKHDLVVQTMGHRPTLKAHDFCVQCSLKARGMSTISVAQCDAQYRASLRSSSGKPRDRVLTTLMSADSLVGSELDRARTRDS